MFTTILFITVIKCVRLIKFYDFQVIKKVCANRFKNNKRVDNFLDLSPQDYFLLGDQKAGTAVQTVCCNGL